MGKKNKDKLPAAKPKPKTPRPEVQVVISPTGFPPIKRARNDREEESQPPQPQPQPRSRYSNLDWAETAKEVRAYASTAFEGKQRRNYQDEQYELLTGRKRKNQRVPLPIVRGIRKAREKREAQAKAEAKAAGIVLATSKNKDEKKERKPSRTYGPAPSIGFMKSGVYRAKDATKRR